MNQKISPLTVVIIIIVCVLLAGGISSYWYLKSSKEAKPTLIEGCEDIKIGDEIKRALYSINIGKEKQDIVVCNEIKNFLEKGYCYGGIAGAKKNLGICLLAGRDLPYLYQRQEVEPTVSNEFNKGVTVVNACFIGAAFVQKDKDICEWYPFAAEASAHIEGVMSSECSSRVETLLTIKNCNLFDYEFSPSDYFMDITEDELVAICEKLSGSKEKDGCFFELAWKRRDISICDKIEEQYAKEVCHFYFSLEGKITGDITLCEKIKDEREKERCYVLVAVHLRDESICKKIEDSRGKNTCFTEVAGELGDINLCEEAEYDEYKIEDYKQSCYKKVAEFLKYETICESDDDRCYSILATREMDIALCDKIQLQSEKEECKWYINTRLKLEKKGWKLGDYDEFYREAISPLKYK